MYFFDSNENNMNDLNREMFNGKKINNLTVIFFLAPWCGHCKDLKPVIDTIQRDLNKTKLNGIMARVYDDDINKMRYKKTVNSFPTISIFDKKGKYKDYEGSRNKEDLNRFLVSIFKKNKNRFDKIKKSNKLYQRLNGLRKGKKILKNISHKIKKSGNNPWKKFSRIYKTLKKKKGKKYQVGGKTKKKKRNKKKGKRKIICKNPNKKKYTRKKREKSCLENSKCVFSSQMEEKGYEAPCYPKKHYWKELNLNWNKVLNKKASKN
jgi:thiol-disulfide isomerase/thioredoxin